MNDLPDALDRILFSERNLLEAYNSRLITREEFVNALADRIEGEPLRLKDGRDGTGRVWAMERCKTPTCRGKRVVVSFSVDDSTWDAVVPSHLNVVCLSCFDAMAQDKRITYADKLTIHPPVTWEHGEE